MPKVLRGFLTFFISAVLSLGVLLLVSLLTGGALPAMVAVLLGLGPRILGPLYLPLVALSYVLTFTVQVLWTVTVGGLLKLLGVRDTPYFRPPARSAVSGFFGWVYYATPIELWAYSTEHS